MKQKCTGNFVVLVFVKWNIWMYLGSCHMVAVTCTKRKEKLEPQQVCRKCEKVAHVNGSWTVTGHGACNRFNWGIEDRSLSRFQWR
jgi:hypothetical protein